MTFLSWLIYLSSINLKNLVFLSAVSGVVLSLFISMSRDVENHNRRRSSPEEPLLNILPWTKMHTILAVIFVVSILGDVLQPNRETIWTIAAIEYGEDTKLLKRVEGILDTWMPIPEEKKGN